MSDTDNGKLCATPEQNGNKPVSATRCTPGTKPDCSSEVNQAARIRVLNDRLRSEGRDGMVVMTNGIAALGLPTVNAIFKAIAGFSAFTGDNDPYGEHDCAVMEAEGHRIIWKIDYYDRCRAYHSPDAANPKVTVRVLTVMLAEEY